MNHFPVLQSFTHITSSISDPVKALVSTQYVELSGWQQFRASVGEVFKQKRASYLAITDKHLVQVQTLGATVIDQKSFSLDEIHDLRFGSEKAPDLKDVHFPTIQITFGKKGKKGLETEEISYKLFPSLFFANLKYSEKVEEVLQMVQMRKELLNRLEKCHQKLEDKKALESLRSS
ncbi:hypothetical protein SAMN04515674_118102 [Pseudarcicella hirudinis]|uniref:Uncharacterized protein n=1 Tax=Pseudarcicella hirudinis TaxID=1079859 RepID=A0A1I5YGK3_9BACT|nr:hypothetical protein [Pseudarcicella hirudinis]SFQ43057.1 hypothetical protein SAMN04515674_118102 [Pseudarcicella hirudinis]